MSGAKERGLKTEEPISVFTVSERNMTGAFWDYLKNEFFRFCISTAYSKRIYRLPFTIFNGFRFSFLQGGLSFKINGTFKICEGAVPEQAYTC